jgi:hypothetical protein
MSANQGKWFETNILAKNAYFKPGKTEILVLKVFSYLETA